MDERHNEIEVYLKSSAISAVLLARYPGKSQVMPLVWPSKDLGTHVRVGPLARITGQDRSTLHRISAIRNRRGAIVG